jgi:hypothetical protein
VRRAVNFPSSGQNKIDSRICRQRKLEIVLSAPVQGQAGGRGHIRAECVTPEGLSGKKRVWFRGIFHLIGIPGESPFVSKLRKAESA